MNDSIILEYSAQIKDREKMQLTEPEVKEFFRLHDGLLLHVNRQLGIMPEIKDRRSLRDAGPHGALKLAEALYSDKGHITNYCTENPDRLSTKTLGIIGCWTRFIAGKFIIYKYTKKNTVFIHLDEDRPPKAYAVMALNTPFQILLGDRLPMLVETVLLPLGSHVISHGLIAPYNIVYGGNIRRSIDGYYEQAISEYGLITTMDGKGPVRRSDEERLKQYLRTGANRSRFHEEIQEIVEKDDALMCHYHQALGKADARTLRKGLRGSGVKRGWFAVLDGFIVSGGLERKAVERAAEEIVPKERWGHIHYFKMR